LLKRDSCLRIDSLSDGAVWNLSQSFKLQTVHLESYAEIDITPINLMSDRNWPRIIDEILRAAIPETPCTLALQLTHEISATVDELMEKIYLFCGGNVSLLSIDESQSKRIATLKIITSKRHTTMNSLSIGIITSGKNDEFLLRILNSVSTLNGNEAIEIEVLVAAPIGYIAPPEILSLTDAIVFVHDPENLPPMISEKKNLFVDAATHENLLITHDRYVFSPEIVETLRNFGGDFDVCAIQATDSNNLEFPHWTAYANGWKSGLRIAENDFDSNIFLNGGLFLVKKSVLRAIPLNPLLGWGYGEDVEWSRRLSHSGVTPKFISGLGVKTLDHRDGYFAWFLPRPESLGVTFEPQKKNGSVETIGNFPVGRPVGLFRFLSREDALRNGMAVGDGLEFNESSIGIIPKNSSASFAVHLECIPAGGVKVRIKFGSHADTQLIQYIFINDQVITASEWNQINETTLEIKLGMHFENLVTNCSIRFDFRLYENRVLRIKSLDVQLGNTPSLKPKTLYTSIELSSCLTSGWYESNEVGTWTRGNIGEIIIPIDSSLRKRNLKIRGVLFKNSWGRQTLQILSDGVEKHFTSIRHDDSEIVEITLRNLKYDKSGFMNLQFVVGDPVSPFALGLADDARLLGFEFKNLEFI
jgi:hypothetical protein